MLDEAGHLTAAPELIVEVLSLGAANQRAGGACQILEKFNEVRSKLKFELMVALGSLKELLR